MADLYEMVSMFPKVGEMDCAEALEPERYSGAGILIRNIVGHGKEKITFNELISTARQASDGYMEKWRELRAEGRGREKDLPYVMVVICLHRVISGLNGTEKL